MILTRRADWLDRLNAVVEQQHHFACELSDCARFAARCIDAMCGSDLSRETNALCDDKAAMVAHLRAAGGLGGAVTSVLGKSVAWALVRRGDLMLLNPESETLGVCLGTHCAAPHRNGLVMVRSSEGLCGWRVG